MLLELSEQMDLAAQSLKPNAEPTVFPPPSPQEELHWDSRMDVVILCLSLVDKHLKTQLPLLRQAAPEASSKMGMREDDVLATLMHQMWAGCYSNALSLPATLSTLTLSSQETEALLKPHKSPMRFSEQTLVDIDRLLLDFAQLVLVEGACTCDPCAPARLTIVFMPLRWVACFSGGPSALSLAYNRLERHLVVLYLERLLYFLLSFSRWEEGSEGLQTETQGKGGGARKGSSYQPQVFIEKQLVAQQKP
ncbi:uncharacterized protein EMH_0009870 [Eimeria mitis]|uniref:Uncharacterized protein n=1 Tax=Eimeria mitis TaxID=44415 RepID=U6K1Q3_9EIME|nr:uncharacterized protein EMH_0009870 [Eimeria mitis]CDJ31675.1 hypothetical protein, conserved [Eimeria mitis]